MLIIESFFKIDDDFIPILDFSGKLPDDFYVEGAIKISQDKKEILSIENWDLIDQTWSRFINGVEKVLENLEFKTFMPADPLFVSFKPDVHSGFVLFQVEEKSISINYDEFINKMIEGATTFFEKMNTLMVSEYDFELERLEHLKKHYNSIS